MSLAECAACPQIVLEADRCIGVLSAVWSRRGLRPPVLMRTSSLEAVRSLVGVGIGIGIGISISISIGAGIALLPDFLYRPWTLDSDHIEARSLRDVVLCIDVGVVWRPGSVSRPVVVEFHELAWEQSRVGRGRKPL